MLQRIINYYYYHFTQHYNILDLRAYAVHRVNVYRQALIRAENFDNLELWNRIHDSQLFWQDQIDRIDVFIYQNPHQNQIVEFCNWLIHFMTP